MRHTVTTVDLTLITVVPGAENANGYTTNTEYTITVTAERTSVVRSEFWEAYKAGITPTAMYRIHPLDYLAARKVVGSVTYDAEYATEGGIRYQIKRTYETTPDTIELTCAKVI